MEECVNETPMISILEIIKEKFELTPNKNTDILSIKGVNPGDILELLDRHGFRQVGCYQSKSTQNE